MVGAPSNGPRVRLAVFDFDGTLADSLPWLLATLDELAAEGRLAPLGETGRAALREGDARAGLAHLGLAPASLPALARRLRRLAEAAPPPPLFPGVPAMLRALAAGGVRLAVVTSNGEATVRRALGSDAALIGGLACGTTLFGKAARLRRVLRAAGVAAGQALFVGDERRDGEAARAAGIPFGAVHWGSTRPGALDDLAAVAFARVDDVTRHVLGADP